MIRLGVLMWVWLIAGAAGVLFHVSYDVTALEEDLSALNRDIVREQEAIRVLRAEWSYLNQPERLRNLARELTSLVPITPGQVIESAAVLPMPLPQPESVAAEPTDLEMLLARVVGTEDPILQAMVLPPRTPERRPLPAPVSVAPAGAAEPVAATDEANVPGETAEATPESLDRGGLASLLTDLGIDQPAEGAVQ